VKLFSKSSVAPFALFKTKKAGPTVVPPHSNPYRRKLACGLYEPANPHGDNREPDEPAVYQHLVILAYGDRQVLAQSPLHQAAINVKGIQVVLHIQEVLEHGISSSRLWRGMPDD
jgi:hypothetical protein